MWMNESAIFYIICISLNLLFPWMRSCKIWNYPVTVYFFMVQWEKEIKDKFHQPHEWITTLYIKSYLVFNSIAKKLTFTFQWSYAFKSILKAATWNNFKCSVFRHTENTSKQLLCEREELELGWFSRCHGTLRVFIWIWNQVNC